METATIALAKQIGKSIIAKANKYGKTGEGWYGPHMDAAACAIAERIPLVDIVLEVRDARIPLSSEYDLLRNFTPSSRRIIVMNKMDLANRSQTKEWMSYFEQNGCCSFGVNAHNKENIKLFLNFLQARGRELKKTDHSSHATTLLLVGIPNVGKSALANSLHQIGRISAAEKGKLKHATLSPQPCETKDISSLKIGSHPNMYVLDTPGILPPEILDEEACSKLTLTGAIADCFAGDKELARYFLTILNLDCEYKKWEKLSHNEKERPLKTESLTGTEMDIKKRRQYHTDHTQDFIVNEVRRIIYKIISSFNGNYVDDERDMARLVEAEMVSLREVFRIPVDSYEDANNKVAAKLLNLYRTGRLGHYTLESLP